MLLSVAACGPSKALRINQPLLIPPVPDSHVALRVDTAVPLMTLTDQPLFSSEVSFRAIDSMLSVRSGYSLGAGDLLTPAEALRWRVGLLPRSLGKQRIGQEARVQLPSFAGAPLILAMRHEQESVWMPDTAVQNLRQGLDLQWSPSFARLRLQWDMEALPWDTRNALDCPLRGQVVMPLLDDIWSMQLGGRNCAVTPPNVDFQTGAAQTWSAGVHWRSSEQQFSTLRVLAVQAQQVDVTTIHPDPAYEVGLDLERRLGEWAAKAGVAWRASDAVNASGEAWVADASLRRNLGLMALTAQWQTGDRYWFQPDFSQPTDDLALSVDMSRWAALRWPGHAPTLALSYQWRTAANGYRDDSLQWRMWLPWR